MKEWVQTNKYDNWFRRLFHRCVYVEFGCVDCWKEANSSQLIILSDLSKKKVEEEILLHVGSWFFMCLF